MPLVRSIVHDAEKNNYRFSSLVIGVVKSDPFQMSTKIQVGANGRARSTADSIGRDFRL